MDEQRIVPFGLVGDSGSAITMDSGFVLSNIRLRAAAVCLRPALCGEPGLRRRKMPLCACARVASSAPAPRKRQSSKSGVIHVLTIISTGCAAACRGRETSGPFSDQVIR